MVSTRQDIMSIFFIDMDISKLQDLIDDVCIFDARNWVFWRNLITDSGKK